MVNYSLCLLHWIHRFEDVISLHLISIYEESMMFPQSASRGGGIGRRTGLKILR